MTTSTESATSTEQTAPASTVPASLVNPAADKVKLPSVPASIPESLAKYGETKGKMAKWQISELTDDLQVLRQHGANLLQQHSATAVATEEFDSGDSAERKAFDDETAEIARIRAELTARETAANEARDAAIAALVSQRAANADIDLELEGAKYSKKYAALVTKTAVGMWTAIAPEVGQAYSAFIGTIPSAEELTRGERKRTSAKVSGTGKDMRPGSKKSFAWWEMDGKRLDATTYGDVAKESGLKGVTAAILTNRLLDDNQQHAAELVDGNVYSFTLTVDNVQHVFKCQPVKRGAKVETEDAPSNAAPDTSAATAPSNDAAPVKNDAPEFEEPVL